MSQLEVAVDKINLISKRDAERKLGLQKRKEDKSVLTADNEKLDFFEETFSDKLAKIENFIAQSGKVDKHELPNHFDGISKEILLLQKYVAASNLFLRTYDIKKCQLILQELSNKAKETEEELLPKKKFGFKNKIKPKLTKKNDNKDEVDFQGKNLIPKQLCGFNNRTDETLVMEGNEILRKDITVENLKNCTIQLFGSPSTLHLNQLENCSIFTGPVSTSIFAENCVNSTLVIACQQLRLHSSRNIKIFLHVTSRAIMEDCHDIFLAPYNLQYKGLECDFEDSGLDMATNNWQCVDDFNWLNVEKPSPNWSLLKKL